MEECATDFLNHLEKVSIDIIFHKKEEWDKFYMDNISRQNINIRGLQASWLVRNASGSLNKTETGSSNSFLDWHRKTKHEKGSSIYFLRCFTKPENWKWNMEFRFPTWSHDNV